MSCCRPSPSKKEVLSRETQRIEMSLERDAETKTVENSSKRKKYLNMKVLDNYVFALESRIPRSKDTMCEEIDIFVKVPLRQIEGSSGLNSNPPSPVPPAPPSPISTSMSPRNLNQKEHDIGGKDSPSREEMMWLFIDEFFKEFPSNGFDENMEHLLDIVYDQYDRDLDNEDDREVMNRVFEIAEKYCPPSPKLKKRKSRSPPRVLTERVVTSQ